MIELLQKVIDHEAFLSEARIVEFEFDDEEGDVTIEIEAATGVWHFPSSELADDDGWVRGLQDVSNQIRLHQGDHGSWQKLVRLLERWQEAQTPLDVIHWANRQGTLIVDLECDVALGAGPLAPIAGIHTAATNQAR